MFSHLLFGYRIRHRLLCPRIMSACKFLAISSFLFHLFLFSLELKLIGNKSYISYSFHIEKLRILKSTGMGFRKNFVDYASEGSRSDVVMAELNIKVDVAPVFNWNVKEIFLFLVAEYSTPKTPLNQVVFLLIKPFRFQVLCGILNLKKNGTFLQYSYSTYYSYHIALTIQMLCVRLSIRKGTRKSGGSKYDMRFEENSSKIRLVNNN